MVAVPSTQGVSNHSSRTFEALSVRVSAYFELETSAAFEK